MPGDFGVLWTDENCYCYAIHYPGNHCDPGTFQNVAFQIQVNPNAAYNAVVSDGATPVHNTLAAPHEPVTNALGGHYLIAMKMQLSGNNGATSTNYHFLRRDEVTGKWYQKMPMTGPGELYINHGVNFVPHTDPWCVIPRLQAFNPYDIWCGYFWVPDAGLTPPPPAQQDGGWGCCVRCYLTTATCQTLGLSDDCIELRTLRWFRDTVLVQEAEGRRQVEQYRREAPRIVAAINAQLDPAVIYRSIYTGHIRPAVTAIQQGDYQDARAIYAGLVALLRERYLGMNDRE